MCLADALQIGDGHRGVAIIATQPTDRRVCFPAAVLAGLENFDLSKLRYFPRQLAWQPSGLSSQQQVVHVVPVKDSVFSLVSWRCSVCFRLTQWHGQPIFSQLSALLPSPPAAVCVLSSPVSPTLVVDIFRVAGSSFSISSAS